MFQEFQILKSFKKIKFSKSPQVDNMEGAAESKVTEEVEAEVSGCPMLLCVANRINSLHCTLSCESLLN